MSNMFDANAYFEEIANAFENAARSRTPKRFLSLVAHGAQLNFANDALIPRVMPALAHLEIPPTDAALQLWLFDSATTHVSLPLAPFQNGIPEQEGWQYADETRHILWNPLFQTLTMLDAARGVGYFWTRDANNFSYHEASFPLRNLWQWWLGGRGLQLAHAAAVCNERGAAVIVGASGAGKSTIALACLQSPLNYLGDDFVLLRAEPEPQVFSLFASAKLHADQLERFPHLQHRVSNAARLDSEKALLFVNQHFPEKIRKHAIVRVLLLPRVVGAGETRAREISAARALRELAVSTLFLLRGAGKAELDALANFARRLPCYELELGADVREIPRVIENVLERG